MPDKSIDCVITDPPYGIGESNEKNLSRSVHAFGNSRICVSTNFGAYSWDSQRVGKEYFEEIFRVSKKQVIFGGNYYTDFLPPRGGWRVWDKRVTDKMSNDLSDCELVWTSENKGVRIFRYLWNGLLQQNMKHKEKRVHPTQKPIAVMKWLVGLHTKQGDTVLDPFMGSGSTGVACNMLGRGFIGIEKDERYFKVAQKRIAQWTGQERL